MVLLPAWVSAKGMPVASTKCRSSAWASEYRTPPPQISMGFLEARMASAASCRAASGAGRRSRRHTRFLKKLTG